MITLYLKQLNKVIHDPDLELFEELGYDDLLWIDMIDPSPKERKIVENYMEVNLQTRQQVEEIESSSRYSESENAIICNSNFTALQRDGSFITHPVSFIISEGVLISVRNSELKTFEEASRKLQMNYRTYTTGFHILVSIMEARIDLDADMVEVISKNIATLNSSHSSEVKDSKVDENVLLEINRLQENTMIIRETIFDRQRLMVGIQRSERFPNDIYPRVTIMIKDIASLISHADFSFERLEFLQDTFMGLINIEQNKIIKMFTILSVIFMPPTLIASVYGMNFSIMPELKWRYGYVFAIALMLLSVIITLYFFKRKKWL